MRKLFSLLMIFGLLCTQVEARHPYHATLLVGPFIDKVSAPNPHDLTNELKTSAIQEAIPFYTPTSPVLFNFNLKGINAEAFFAANSTVLTVTMPQIGITETFAGATREDSFKLFEIFLKEAGSGSGHRGRFLRAHVKYTPIDPIAGNPNSLMSTMATSDYSFGRLSPLAGCSCGWEVQPIRHQFQAGIDYGRAFCDGFETTIATFPLRYSYSPCGDWALILDAPLTVFEVGGATSVFGSIGTGLRVPTFSEYWTLTPTLRVGFGGTLDMCTAGTFISPGLVSNIDYPIWDHVLSMTNYVGYFHSLNFWLCGVNFNYRLKNWVFKNGLAFTSCEWLEFCGRPLNYNITFADTAYAGNKQFIEHWDEIGLNLIINNVNPWLDYDCLSLGVSFQWGQESFKAFFFKSSYQF